MTREQAAEINRHLQRAANAIRRSEKIMWRLPQEDRAELAEPLGKTVVALHFELLHVIYRRFPDLRPPSKGSRFIDSKLTWKKVQLPSSVTEADLDAVLLSVMKPRWRKVAMILIRAKEQCADWPIDYEIISARIRALADADRIEAQGDLRKWRFSEVRLKN